MRGNRRGARRPLLGIVGLLVFLLFQVSPFAAELAAVPEGSMLPDDSARSPSSGGDLPAIGDESLAATTSNGVGDLGDWQLRAAVFDLRPPSSDVRDVRWRRPISPPPSAFELRTSIAEAESRGARWRAVSVELATVPTLFEGRMSGVAELAYAPFEGLTRELGSATRPYGLLRLGIAGEWQGLAYGGEYRAVGKNLENLTRLPADKRDQDGTELWVESGVGPARIQLSLAELSDNVDRDPARPRITKSLAGVTTQLAPPSWPRLSLGYFRGFAERSEGLAPKPDVEFDRSAIEELVGSLFYGEPAWDVSMSVTYSPTTDERRPSRETGTLRQAVHGSYRPARSITISSAVNRTESRSQWSGSESRTLSTSIALAVSPVASGFDVTLAGTYARTTSSDGAANQDTVTVASGVARTLAKWQHGYAAVSVDVSYTGHRDTVYRAASSRDSMALLLFKVVSF